MPSILHRYILRETVQTWLVVTLVLLLILVTNQFADVLGDAAANRLPKQALMRVMLLTSAQYLTILIPVGLFLAIMISLGRLYRDSEMAAIMACGIGPVGLYRPLLFLAALAAAVVGWLALVAGPDAVRQVEQIAIEAQRESDLSVVEPGRFISFADDEAVLYAESVSDDGVLGNVFVQRRAGDQVEVIVAKTARQSESEDEDIRVLRFADGRRYEGVPGSARMRILQFAEHGIPFTQPSVDATDTKPETRPLAMLLASDDPADQAELQWRVSLPVTLIVLTLLAVPLSRTAPRQGRYGGLAYGILIYIIYVNLLGAAKVWVEREEVPAFIGLWWVHVLLMFVAALLMFIQYGYLRRFFYRGGAVAAA